jgi:hypothetical protein
LTAGGVGKVTGAAISLPGSERTSSPLMVIYQQPCVNADMGLLTAVCNLWMLRYDIMPSKDRHPLNPPYLQNLIRQTDN